MARLVWYMALTQCEHGQLGNTPAYTADNRRPLVRYAEKQRHQMVFGCDCDPLITLRAAS